MILGLGLDLVKIERMERAATKEAFRLRVFTEGERVYAEARPARAAEIYAGMFAAKEAAAKALGTGFAGFSPADIEVRHGENGVPSLLLTGGAEARRVEMRAARLLLSITHDGGMAAATVIAEGDT